MSSTSTNGELKIEWWPIEAVKPYENNVKIHDEEQVEKIAQSIKQFGFDQPIVVDKDGVIIKGHGRTEASRFLGLKKVPVLVRRDLTEEQIKAARIADNRVAISDFDTVGLQNEIASIDLDLSGIFDKKELAFLEADLSEFKPEAVSTDLYADIEKKATETEEKIIEADEAEVRIADALGFKTIKGAQERTIARFMAKIEGETSKVGADAFVEFAQNYIK